MPAFTSRPSRSREEEVQRHWDVFTGLKNHSKGQKRETLEDGWRGEVRRTLFILDSEAEGWTHTCSTFTEATLFIFFTLCVFYEKYFITSVCAMTVKELARLRRRG